MAPGSTPSSASPPDGRTRPPRPARWAPTGRPLPLEPPVARCSPPHLPPHPPLPTSRHTPPARTHTRGHTYAARPYCSCPPPAHQVSDALRHQTKGLVYGILYGKGPNALGVDLSLDPKDAWALRCAFVDSFPQLKAWLQARLRFQ